MLQRQIVKALGNPIDIEDIVCSKYADVSFHSISCMLISVNVTIYRIIPVQRYQSSSIHCIMMIETRSSM